MTERRVRVGGVEIWSEAVGDPEGAPLLLIMGANASGLVWPEAFVKMLAAGGHRVIRYDHRDTGTSTRRAFAARPYSVEDLARDAVGVLDGHGVEAAHVVGMSMGGTVGQVLALDHRERLRTLTVMMTAALGVDFVGNMQRAMAGLPSLDGLPTPRREVLEALGGRAQGVRDREAELDRRVAEWRVLSGEVLPFDAEAFRAMEERVMDHAGTLDPAMTHLLAEPVALARGAELGGITTPTLVIQGMADPLNPPPHGRYLAGKIPGSRCVEVPGMGHALIAAVQRTVAEAILARTQA
ncbi:alpha/beta fold hydrolase [Chondromyces apiculatus]|uniref:Hydrolase, alpha/beta fold family n=1 Tax=Chondromyces apiculatus DSM 436 TaxID=1192034 RepID=A0A017SWS3_9BACT|nr:alpha/beta fold hydrolase [Chondromyces apiculatus]EYF01217.1 hydrolase, alpha/beta fold family [Chondromyces apiculatus DSM 436]